MAAKKRRKSRKQISIRHIDFAIVPKSHPSVYLMHKYWARKPHNVVAAYIKTYSKPNKTVLDPFCGSGVTAIESIRLGRKAVAVDLDPVATFITRCTLLPLDLKKFTNTFKEVENKVRAKMNQLYLTKCENCKKEVITEATIWENNTPKEIRYTCNCRKGTQWKNLGQEDYELIGEVQNMKIPYWYPKNKLIWNSRINVNKGTRISDLFTRRNLIALSSILHEIELISDKIVKELMRFTFSSALPQASKMVFVYRKKGRERDVGGWATRGYWVPREYFEINAWNCFENRFKKVLRGKEQSNKLVGKLWKEAKSFKGLKKDNTALILTRSALNLRNIPANSVEYIFTDPSIRRFSAIPGA